MLFAKKKKIGWKEEKQGSVRTSSHFFLQTSVRGKQSRKQYLMKQKEQ